MTTLKRKKGNNNLALSIALNPQIMTKRIQSIVYFALLIIACLVYTATDSTTGDNEFSTNKTEIIKKNTISLNTY
ncbi:hypothetical protein Celal_0788 [Cellulophaga algicola DSM 14237]|uniref:Uncharacterized protein n=2 Tax=Cellulophaga TaxID=104264 RepID=E6XES0_CELAD|nr:hypothetical protein Celal_0788 [Cellulophaga algicola DSM 14237]